MRNFSLLQDLVTQHVTQSPQDRVTHHVQHLLRLGHTRISMMKKQKEKHLTLNASRQAKCKVQYNPYYANTEDST